MSGQLSKTGHLFRESKPLNRNHSSVCCDNYIYGCSQRFYTNEERLQHKNSCEFDPNVSVICDDCQKVMFRSQEKRHNCIKELRAAINELKQVISGLEEKINEQIVFKDNAQQILEASPQTMSTPQEVGGSYRHFNDIYSDQNKKEIFESEPKYLREKGKDKQMIGSDKSYFVEQNSSEVDFPTYGSMYGSHKHKLLAQMSRELDGILPPIDYETDPTIELDLKKKNKQELIDVYKSRDNSSDETSLVRLRSWSQRN